MFFLRIIPLFLFSLFPIQVFCQVNINFEEGFGLSILEVNRDEFEITAEGDSIFIQQLSYEGIDGKELKFSKSIEKLKIIYEFGFLQYTIDDNPASPLPISVWENGLILKGNYLPDLYNNHPARLQVHEFLGFERRGLLDEYIFSNNFSSIREESIEYQTLVYKEVLSDSLYKTCCPEFIEQANEFFKRDSNSFKSMEDLGLEFYIKSTILEIEFKEKPVSKKVIKIIGN